MKKKKEKFDRYREIFADGNIEIKNLDKSGLCMLNSNWEVISTSHGFGKPENRDKLNFIIECAKKGMDLPWVYSDIPLESMHIFVDYIYEKPQGKSPVSYFDIFKLANSRIPNEPEKLKYVCIALSYGVRMIDDIENLFDHDISIYKAVAEAASHGYDICDKIRPGITVEELN